MMRLSEMRFGVMRLIARKSPQGMRNRTSSVMSCGVVSKVRPMEVRHCSRYMG